MSHLPPTAILEGDRSLWNLKEHLTENFVAQELTTLFHKRLYYWTSGADAEVDFVIPTDTEFYPLEVKSGENKRKKSLLVFSEKYHPSLILRASPDELSSRWDLSKYSFISSRSLFKKKKLTH